MIELGLVCAHAAPIRIRLDLAPLGLPCGSSWRRCRQWSRSSAASVTAITPRGRARFVGGDDGGLATCTSDDQCREAALMKLPVDSEAEPRLGIVEARVLSSRRAAGEQQVSGRSAAGQQQASIHSSERRRNGERIGDSQDRRQPPCLSERPHTCPAVCPGCQAPARVESGGLPSVPLPGVAERANSTGRELPFLGWTCQEPWHEEQSVKRLFVSSDSLQGAPSNDASDRACDSGPRGRDRQSSKSLAGARMSHGWIFSTLFRRK